MGDRIKAILIFFVLLIVSCSSQRRTNSYSECMEKEFLPLGKDFYGDLENIEDMLLDIGALTGKRREDYIIAFRKLIYEDNVEWKQHYLVLNETVLKDFDFISYEGHLFSFCSNIDLDKLEYNSSDMQKYFFHLLSSKPHDDNEVLDGLVLFTDFSNNFLI